MDANLNGEIEKLFPVLAIILPRETLNELIPIASDEMYLLHFGLGLFIRNNLLNPDSRIYSAFISAGIYHKDDMSTMILSLFCNYLRKL